MPTPANSLDVSSSGLVKFDGTATFSGVTVTQHDVLVGAASNGITSVAPSSTSGVPLISQGASADPAFGTTVVAGGGTGDTSFTAHSLLLGQGTSPITALGAATDGQLPIGSTGVDPVLTTLTQGSGISITNGAGSITIAANGGVATTYTEDTGTATPSANNLNVLGSGSITTSGSGSTITTSLTGLTNHNVLVGAGTSTITKVAPSATSGIPLVSNGSSADPSFTTAVVAGGGTGVTSTTAYGLVAGGTTSTGALQNAGTGTSGQVYKSGGSAALGSWVAPSSIGAFQLIQSKTASNSATLDFTTNVSSYFTILAVVSVTPITSTDTLRMLVSTNGGVSYVGTGGYAGGITYCSTSGTTFTNANSTAFFQLSGPDNNGSSVSVHGLLTGISSGTMQLTGTSVWNDTTLSTFGMGFFGGQSASGVNALRFQFSTGNISTGIITLYGMTTS